MIEWLKRLFGRNRVPKPDAEGFHGEAMPYGGYTAGIIGIRRKQMGFALNTVDPKTGGIAIVPIAGRFETTGEGVLNAIAMGATPVYGPDGLCGYQWGRVTVTTKDNIQELLANRRAEALNPVDQDAWRNTP